MNIKYNKALWLIIILAIVMMIPFLGLTDFNTKGEPREAVVAYTMLEHGNWILPINNGGDIPYKPPFFHWCIAFFSLFIGHVNEYTSRLPSAVSLVLMTIGGFVFYAKRKDTQEVGFNLIKLCVRNVAGKGDHLGAGYPGTFSCGEQLNALGGAVCPLVVLAGQELHGKHPLAGGEGYFVCRIVQIVLGKDPVHGTAELRLADALHIVAVNKPQAGERCNAHILAQIR